MADSQIERLKRQLAEVQADRDEAQMELLRCRQAGSKPRYERKLAKYRTQRAVARAQLEELRSTVRAEAERMEELVTAMAANLDLHDSGKIAAYDYAAERLRYVLAVTS